MGKTRVYTGFWWENLGARDHLEDIGVDESIILKIDLHDGGTWTRFIWLRIEKSGRIL
jgi:hypothetical protein